jgi:hypothetical protein
MKGAKTKKELSAEQREKLLSALKARFEKNLTRHQGLAWAKVQARLEANPDKLWSLAEMERTGGEPDALHRRWNRQCETYWTKYRRSDNVERYFRQF